MNFIIFPNQLFEKQYIPTDIKINKIIIIEHPIFFGQRDIKMNFNKLKLVLHRSSMKYYSDYLKKNKYSVEYIDYKDCANFLKKVDKKKCYYFELNDHLLSKKVKFMKENMYKSPNFLLSYEQMEEYNKKNKTFVHQKFYNMMRNEFNVIPNSKTYDMENRKKLPNKINIPKLPTISKNKYVKEAQAYIDKLFPKNYGNTDNFIYPITHEEVKKWFNNFLKEKFKNFGTYEDAIDDRENFIFHSVMSPMINIGLINPSTILEMIEPYKNKVGMNNYEGFVRQILGWREYQRYCYHFAYDKMINSNVFEHKKKLSKKWYNGTLGIKPVDDAIKNGFEQGYLHHILRLMVISNFMNLCEIHPKECYKWFMEFAVDSYDWVMIQNVYSMGQWADGGMTMRKPYVSSDNYILNMSNYKKDEWCIIWNNLYYYFLSKNKEILRKTPYIRNLSYFEKKSSQEQKSIIESAKNFIKKS